MDNNKKNYENELNKLKNEINEVKNNNPAKKENEYKKRNGLKDYVKNIDEILLKIEKEEEKSRSTKGKNTRKYDENKYKE